MFKPHNGVTTKCSGHGEEQRTFEMGPEGWEGVWKRELIGIPGGTA